MMLATRPRGFRRLRLKREVTVQKLLRCAGGRLVQFFQSCNQTEAFTQLGMKRLCIVANRIQPAASRGTLRPKGAHDKVTAGFER